LGREISIFDTQFACLTQFDTQLVDFMKYNLPHVRFKGFHPFFSISLIFLFLFVLQPPQKYDIALTLSFLSRAPLSSASVDFALPVLLNRRHPLLSPPPSLIHRPPLPWHLLPLRSRHLPSHVHPARSLERVLHHISRSSISWARRCLRPRLVLHTAVPLQRHCFMFSGCPRSCTVVAAE